MGKICPLVSFEPKGTTLCVMKPAEREKIINAAVETHKGHIGPLQQAIGMLYTTEAMGWRAAYLMHDKRTIQRSERILGIEFKEHFEEEGPMINRSIAWKALSSIKDYWKAVRGEIKGVRSPDLDE